MTSGATITVQLVRSPIGYSQRQKDTVRSLGFKHLQQRKTLPDNEAVRGMVQAVCHMVKIVEADEEKKTS